MKLHGNAALTPKQRLRLARRVVEADWSLAEAAAAAEMSERTASCQGAANSAPISGAEKCTTRCCGCDRWVPGGDRARGSASNGLRAACAWFWLGRFGLFAAQAEPRSGGAWAAGATLAPRSRSR
jgi:leucine-zipper of insertion element IS481